MEEQQLAASGSGHELALLAVILVTAIVLVGAVWFLFPRLGAIAKDALRLYSGVLGAVVVMPATIIAVMGFGLKAVLAGSSTGIPADVILSMIALILVMATPAFTAVNVARPENALRKTSAALVTVAGLMAVAAVAYTLSKAFTGIQVVVMFAAVNVLLSGVLQFRD
jgi:cytochrome bd-type quinol oxidase subunit 2